MFTGIIETTGNILSQAKNQTNITFTIMAPFVNELVLGQSVAHDGVCLTIETIDLSKKCYTVTAIAETLSKTNLGAKTIGQQINLERCMKADGRFDGHIVQGHVDTTAECYEIATQNGSTLFTFNFDQPFNELVVDKGSITINGVSLTVVEAKSNQLKVALIPFTLQHTNLGALQIGQSVNIEFDILGKYISKKLNRQ